MKLKYDHNKTFRSNILEYSVTIGKVLNTEFKLVCIYILVSRGMFGEQLK